MISYKDTAPYLIAEYITLIVHAKCMIIAFMFKENIFIVIVRLNNLK